MHKHCSILVRGTCTIPSPLGWGLSIKHQANQHSSVPATLSNGAWYLPEERRYYPYSLCVCFSSHLVRWLMDLLIRRTRASCWKQTTKGSSEGKWCVSMCVVADGRCHFSYAWTDAYSMMWRGTTAYTHCYSPIMSNRGQLALSYGVTLQFHPIKPGPLGLWM